MPTGDIPNSQYKELTPEQLHALCKALEVAVPEPETLERIVLGLGEYLTNIPKANTHPGLILNLVKWAKAKGKIRKLIIEVSLESPLNPQLQQFVKKHIQSLLELDPIDLPRDLLFSLISCLQETNDFTESIWRACIKTLPNLDISSPNIKDLVFHGELSGEVKWLIILELLLHTWEGNDEKGQLNIVKFVENLEVFSEESYKSSLTQWLKELPTSLRPLSRTSSSISRQERPSNETLKSLQAYFLIVIEPPEITTQTGLYGINGYLMTHLGSSAQFTQIYTLNLKPPAKVLNSGAEDEIDHVSAVLQQTKGVFCSLQQIEDNLPDWLVQAQNEIDIRCSELQSEYELSFRPIYDLSVEFWLPFECLTAAADTWKIYGKPVRLKQRRLVVGEEYRVVVRSYDRFSDSDALNNLNRMWQELTRSLEELVATEENVLSEGTSRSASSGIVQPQFHSLDCWSRIATLRSQILPACWALALTSPFDIKEYEPQRDELFALILEKGIPMALWSRKSSISGIQEAMDELLTSYTSSQINELLDQVKQIRKSANEQQLLGKHLAIWCDEPKRLMELKQFLRKSGRLSA
ncbi:hypothetical protein H6F89_34060 [Cyanobacteria bacterium FACHB-63]|nr:hypothetical protein [Cyanobacteria bacterium FACHB-63]